MTKRPTSSAALEEFLRPAVIEWKRTALKPKARA